METITKQTLRGLGEQVSAEVGGKSVQPFVGTWMGRPGCSIEVRLTSKRFGKRVVVHKWEDEETCKVTHNEGDFWKDPGNARTFGEVEGVEFTAEAIVSAFRGL